MKCPEYTYRVGSTRRRTECWVCAEEYGSESDLQWTVGWFEEQQG